MSRCIRPFAIVAAVLLTPSPLAAQGVTMTGRVIEEGTGRVVAGAQVQVVGTTLGTEADAEGAFRIAGVPTGNRFLRVVRLGYRSLETMLSIPADGEMRLEIELSPQPVEVEPVEAAIEAPRDPRDRGRTDTIRRMDSQEIAHYHGMPIEELIERLVPGTEAVREFTMDVADPQSGCPVFRIGRPTHSLRGKSGYVQPLIVVDGIPSSDTCILNFLNVDDIAEIEYESTQRAGSRWGSRAAGGAIVITTKDRVR